jgi:hypothetical protein
VTRGDDELFQNYDGLLFLIDAGMSRGIDGDWSKGGALMIVDSPVSPSSNKPGRTVKDTFLTFQSAKVRCANTNEQVIWDSRKSTKSASLLCG